MSNKIGGYYLPNKVANDYIANKRSETGETIYEGELQNIGMDTQAAIQSLNKTYSNVINDAYSSYLNSKRSIVNSNMGQGYKEAYMQRQEQAYGDQMEEAYLSAAETKQDILKQQAESNALVGKAFQNEVLNMEKVATNLTAYMNYLKTISKDGVSYYDTLVDNQGLKDFDASVGVQAEDIYDALYNAAPLNYMTEDEVAGLNWMDWLKTQIKTEKDQAWYDWYLGEGGYEQFQDAYKKSESTTAGYQYKLEQEKKRKAEAEKARIEAKNKAKAEAAMKAEIEFNTPKQTKKGGMFNDLPEYSYRGEIYTGTFIGRESTIGQNISRDLNIRKKIKSGEIRYNSVIEYKGDLYIVHYSDGTVPSYTRLKKK